MPCAPAIVFQLVRSVTPGTQTTLQRLYHDVVLHASGEDSRGQQRLLGGTVNIRNKQTYSPTAVGSGRDRRKTFELRGCTRVPQLCVCAYTCSSSEVTGNREKEPRQTGSPAVA